MLPTDAARLPATRRAGDRVRLAAFAALSLAVHASLLMYFSREPEPLASIGIEVISAEIVLGATAPAGAAPTPGELELNTAKGATDPQQTDPQREAEQKATEQPQNVQVAREETAPEQTTTLERQADERLPDDNAAAPREERQPAEPKPAIAMVESATPDIATAAPREIPPDAMDVSLLPQPEEKPVEQKPEPKEKQAAPPKPVKNAATAPGAPPHRSADTRQGDARNQDIQSLDGGEQCGCRAVQQRHQLPRARLRAPRALQAVSLRGAQPRRRRHRDGDVQP